MAGQYDAEADTPIAALDLAADDRFVFGCPSDPPFGVIEAGSLLEALLNVSTLDTWEFKAGTGAETGRTFVEYHPNPDFPGISNLGPFRVRAGLVESPGNDSNFVLEIGPNLIEGGQVDSAFGGFRIAIEQRFWTGSTYLGEVHLAAVRSPAQQVSGGTSEYRSFSSTFDQNGDTTNTGIAGDEVNILSFNDDRDYEQLARFRWNEGDPTCDFLDTRLAIAITSEDRTALELAMPAGATTEKFLTLSRGAGVYGSINSFGQVNINCDDGGSGDGAAEDFYFRGRDVAGGSTFRVDDGSAQNRIDLARPSGAAWHQHINRLKGIADISGGLKVSLELDGSGGTLVDTDAFGTIKLGGSGKGLGFFQGGGTTKQTVTGVRDSNPALANLLTALAGYGLLTDSTTAS